LLVEKTHAIHKPVKLLKGLAGFGGEIKGSYPWTGLHCQLEDWVMMAKRYEDHPEVIGYDIRNEAPDVVV